MEGFKTEVLDQLTLVAGAAQTIYLPFAPNRGNGQITLYVKTSFSTGAPQLTIQSQPILVKKFGYKSNQALSDSADYTTLALVGDKYVAIYRHGTGGNIDFNGIVVTNDATYCCLLDSTEYSWMSGQKITFTPAVANLTVDLWITYS